jgi:transcriptional regulator with XRE-family HTH domain
MREDFVLKAFGSSIQRARNDRGLSQEKLAELAGLDRTYVSSVERGQRNISILNIVKFAKALSINPSSLLENIGAYDE